MMEYTHLTCHFTGITQCIKTFMAVLKCATMVDIHLLFLWICTSLHSNKDGFFEQSLTICSPAILHFLSEVFKEPYSFILIYF